uniref:Uncharacterized protein n=1 Tax=Stegastes partitus TaxID=144197 RepID=A0A3B4ZMK2_9TELE
SVEHPQDALKQIRSMEASSLRRIGGFVMLWGAFCWHSLEGEVSLSDHLYPLMKYFSPDGSDLLRDDNASTQRAPGISERCDEDENNMNHRLWSPALKAIEQL